jgi:glucosamine 6-phosphate synthetase-like amidotransferase/phosphosugar isomerase protein
LDLHFAHHICFFVFVLIFLNIERELTELQNKKQASNREEIEKRINLLENELKTFYEKKTEGAMIRAKELEKTFASSKTILFYFN